HEQHPAGPLQGGDELRRRAGRMELALAAVVGEELVGAGGGAVVDGHRVAVTGEVAGEVAAHDTQSHHADPRLSGHASPASRSGSSLGSRGRAAPAGAVATPALQASAPGSGRSRDQRDVVSRRTGWLVTAAATATFGLA